MDVSAASSIACLTCWISLSWWLTVSRRCLRSVSEDSSSRRMELLRPSACCNFCSRSSTSEWANLKCSSKSLFSCSCGSTHSSQLADRRGVQDVQATDKKTLKHLLYRALNSYGSIVFSCLCGHQFLYSGHFRDVRVDPQFQLILLMQSLLHLHMYSLHKQTVETQQELLLLPRFRYFLRI